MKNALLFLFVLITGGQAIGQKVYESYVKLNDNLRVGNGPRDLFPYGSKGYTLILPEGNDHPARILLMLEDNKVNLRDTTQAQFINISREATTKGFGVLYISTGIPVDLYFSPNSLVYVDTVMQDVFARYHLPTKDVFLLGAMVSGHRALKYIEYCKEGKSTFNPNIKGVVLSESAIDWVRQWYECQKQVRDHLTDVGFFEGNFITYLFQTNIKDTPITNIDKYIDFSPYSYFDTKMKKPSLYKDLAIRAYTYADTRYWFSAQGKGVYDSNYPDMSGFINEQKLAGNNKAELIVFHSNPDEPLKSELRRQPATWALVDREELVKWLLAQTK